MKQIIRMNCVEISVEQKFEQLSGKLCDIKTEAMISSFCGMFSSYISGFRDMINIFCWETDL